jgi:5-methyltetrahydrofolate--homocysteine methyltransferase
MRYFETLQNARDHRKNPTPAEKFVWNKLRNRKFYGMKFNRQYLIEYKQIMHNRLYYIADFHNFEHKIVIEIDGPIHQEQQEYDQERQANIEAIGYKVIRFTNEDVIYNWEDVENRLLFFIPIPLPLPSRRKG